MQKQVALGKQETGAVTSMATGQQKNSAVSQAGRVLYIVQLPPPVHGVSAMNKYVVSSPVVNERLTTRTIALRFSTNNDQLEKASFAKAVRVLTYGFSIAKAMITFRPALVYFTFMPTGFAFYRDALYVFLLKLFSPQIVLHLHGKGIKRSLAETAWKRNLYKAVFKNTHVVSLSPILAGDVAPVYNGRPFIVPNGIPVHPSAAGAVNNQNVVPQILFLSNYIENKGVLVLMRALALLKKQGHQFTARFVGAPTNLSVDRLTEISREYGLEEAVTIVGPRYGEEKYEELRRADIFAFPTYNDAFPLVALEAMQFSLPIVSTDEGGVPDIVNNNESGFLVERQNPQMLAEKLALLIENKTLRGDMGQKGYERFRTHFTLQHFEKKLKQTFDAILLNAEKK